MSALRPNSKAAVSRLALLGPSPGNLNQLLVAQRPISARPPGEWAKQYWLKDKADCPLCPWPISRDSSSALLNSLTPYFKSLSRGSSSLLQLLMEGALGKVSFINASKIVLLNYPSTLQYEITFGGTRPPRNPCENRKTTCRPGSWLG